MRSKATCDDVVVVEWGGFKSTVEDEKARQVVQGWRQVSSELAQCQTPKEKVSFTHFSILLFLTTGSGFR